LPGNRFVPSERKNLKKERGRRGRAQKQQRGIIKRKKRKSPRVRKYGYSESSVLRNSNGKISKKGAAREKEKREGPRSFNVSSVCKVTL